MKRKEKKYPVACRIIYKSTKEAVETGDTESLFLDPEKVKELVGVSCERVKREEFSELPLDNFDILILHTVFLEWELSRYYRGEGIDVLNGTIEDLNEDKYVAYGINLSHYELKACIRKYIDCGLIMREEIKYRIAPSRYKYKATDKLIRLGNHKHDEWAQIIDKQFKIPYLQNKEDGKCEPK